MTARILSRHGNVIAADFRPRTTFDLTVTFNTETLYCDGVVILTRTTAQIAGKTLVTLHFLGDLATGHIVQLNNNNG